MRRPWERGRLARKWAAGPPVFFKRAGRPRSQEAVLRSREAALPTALRAPRAVEGVRYAG